MQYEYLKNWFTRTERSGYWWDFHWMSFYWFLICITQHRLKSIAWCRKYRTSLLRCFVLLCLEDISFQFHVLQDNHTIVPIHQFHTSQNSPVSYLTCSIQNRNVHISVLNGEFWDMEAFSSLPALCAGNAPVTGEFLSQKPVTRGFDVFFDLRLNKRLRKQSRRRWLETPSRSLWHHWNYSIWPWSCPPKPLTLRTWCRKLIPHDNGYVNNGFKCERHWEVLNITFEIDWTNQLLPAIFLPRVWSRVIIDFIFNPGVISDHQIISVCRFWLIALTFSRKV